MTDKPIVEPGTIYTVGHSTRSIEDFIDLLKAYRITTVADVRTVPRSRTNPQFNYDSLPPALDEAGMQYVHMPALGGLRRPTGGSVNAAWRNMSFRGYADYMQTPEFESALNELIDLAQRKTVATMCAEAVPWRCHRSLIADALVARSIPVLEIMSLKSCRIHTLTAWARVEGTRVTYPPAETAPQGDDE